MSKTESHIPKLRFAGFSDLWKDEKLGAVVKYIKGFAFSANLYQEQGIQIIRVSDLGLSSIVKKDAQVFIDRSLINTYKNYLINQNDILITTVGSKSELQDSAVGRAIFIRNDIDGLLNQNLVKISENGVHSSFLYCLFLQKKYRDHVAMIERGNANQANITIADLWEYKFQKPESKEQTKIGDFFQKIDQVIELQQKSLETARDYKKSMLQKMFPQKGEKVPKVRFDGFSGNWEYYNLDEITDRFDNLRVPISASERISGNTPYYGANGIQGYVKGYTHDGENILIAEDGANDLSDYPIQYVFGKIWVNNHAHVLSAKSSSDTKFLSYGMKNINFVPFLVGGGRAKLNANVMMQIKLLIPELEEQQKIGAFFQKLDQQIEQHEKKLESYQSLKKAMLQRMFV